MKTEILNVVAADLPNLLTVTRNHESEVKLRAVGYLQFFSRPIPDQPMSDLDLVPGALVEGVIIRPNQPFPDAQITIWAGDAMHQIDTDLGAEVEVRLVGEHLPQFEVCGRCNRHLIPAAPGGEPWSARHVGC